MKKNFFIVIIFFTCITLTFSCKENGENTKKSISKNNDLTDKNARVRISEYVILTKHTGKIELPKTPTSWKQNKNTNIKTIKLPENMKFDYFEDQTNNEYKKQYKFLNKKYFIYMTKTKRKASKIMYAIFNSQIKLSINKLFFYKIINKNYNAYYYTSVSAMNGAKVHSLIIEGKNNDVYRVSISLLSTDSKDEIAKQILGSIELN